MSLGPSAVTALLDAIGGADPKPPVVQAGVRRLLPRYGPQALPALSKAGSRDSAGRESARQYMWHAAIDAAVDMGPAAIRPLARMLATPDRPLERYFAAYALARLGPAATAELEPLLTHPDKEVRDRASWALVERPGPASRQALLSGAKNKDHVVRARCLGGLAALRDTTLVNVFAEAMKDDDPYVRQMAAGGLASIFESRFRAPLAQMACCDEEFLVRSTVAELLTRLPDRVAQRLGRRYRPLSLSPVDVPTIQVTYVLAFTATAAALGALGFVTLAHQVTRVGLPRRLLGMAVAGLVGIIWGGGLSHIVRPVEILWLVFLLPIVGAFGLGAIRGRDHRQSPRGNAWLSLIGASYVGFALGWLWLWGYVGS